MTVEVEVSGDEAKLTATVSVRFSVLLLPCYCSIFNKLDYLNTHCTCLVLTSSWFSYMTTP